MSHRVSSFLKAQKSALALLAGGLVCIAVYAGFAYRHAPDITRICSADSNKPLCYSKHIEDILRTRGIPAAFDALALAYDNDPGFAGTCHAVTHDLGKAAYDEFHKTGRTELTSKASYCGYGLYHGFMDALFVDTNDLNEARAFCTYVGQNVPHPPAPEFAEGSCYHGIGHGITDGTDPRLWGNAVGIAKPGLVLCKEVAGGNAMWQMRCSSGVFNAIGNMYFDPKYKLDPDPDPYSLCRKGGFSKIDEESCYNQMNTQAAALGHGELPAIIAYTNAIRDSHLRRIAMREAVSYYVQLLKRSQKQLSVADMNLCETQPTTELKDNCVGGLIGGVYEFGTPGEQYTEALHVCSDETLDAHLRPACFSEVAVMTNYYFAPGTVARVCAEIPSEYAKDCVSR